MSATTVARSLEDVRKIMAPLEGYRPLHKFVLAYANINPDTGCMLTDNPTALEGLLFAIWLEACAELGLQPGDPTCAARKRPDRPSPAPGDETNAL